jgi:hypothetical protein
VKSSLLVLLAVLAALPCAKAQVSTGTAFSVAPQLLVTNQHVISGCSTLAVITPEGRRAASVVSSEASIDLALLRVFGMRGAVANLRTPRSVALGETISVFGFPLTGTLSSSGNFTGGLVSSLQGLRNAVGEIQITAPVQPGNSGGPVMDASGLVVGVVQSKLDAVRAAALTGDMPQNVNFAVALDVLADFLEMNQVPFRSSPRGASLDTAQVARMAQQFTYRVECEGAAASPAPPQQAQRGLPPCLGDSATSFWTNCVGTYITASGHKYMGEFRDNKQNGQGTYTLPDGQKFVGEYRDGKRNGQGTETYPDGQKFVGEYRDGKRNGQGSNTFPSGQKHVGEYRDDKPNGQGTVTFPEGHKYVGEFRDDNYHGQGTYTYPDGSKYVGEYRHDKRNGQGTFLSPSGRVIYSGQWANGERVR